ncbi:MAG: flagellar motor switch protein FliN [Desulfovibrio sp.]|nr:flagellar motor switch protein FliN [Desulfovibrio sp.]
MSQEDQDALAAQWEAELAQESDEANASGGAAEPAAPSATPPAGADAQRQADEALAAQWAASMAQDEEAPTQQSFGSAGAGMGGQVTDAHFKDMTETARQPGDNKLKRELDFILDIPLDVSAELGRTRLLINELLQLGQGSVVELNKLAGEPLEVYVNGKLVARGEAVVINEKFGVRLTDIISPIERVKQLG